jgi:hypothetical protein
MERNLHKPNAQHLYTVRLTAPLDPQPMTTIVYRVSHVKCGLENYSCLDSTRSIFPVSVELVFITVEEVLITKAVVGEFTREPGCSAAGSGFELSGALPFGTTGEP